MKKNEYEKMYFLEDSHFWFIGKRYYIDTYLKKIKRQNLKILDIGSGTGGTTKFLEKFGSVIGIEKNALALNLAKKRSLQIIRGEAEKLPFTDKAKFDLVTIFDVLYHKDVKKLTRAVGEINRVLKSGGYLLITDSAFDFLKGRHSKELDEGRRFTTRGLNKLLAGNSFTIIASSYIFITLFPLIYLKRRIWERFDNKKNSDVFKVSGFVNGLLLNLLRLEAKLLTHFSFPLGSSLIILARKDE